jgi:hypothetical protein
MLRIAHRDGFVGVPQVGGYDGYRVFAERMRTRRCGLALQRIIAL